MLDPGDQVRAGRVRHELQGAPIGSQSAGVVGRVVQVVLAVIVPHDTARVRIEILGAVSARGEHFAPLLVMDEIGGRHEVPRGPARRLSPALVEVVELELTPIGVGDDISDPVGPRPEEDLLSHRTSS